MSGSSPAAARSIKLTKYSPDRFVEGRTQGYRLFIQASDAVGLSVNIFVYRQGSVNPETSDTESSFAAVASPSDIEEYQVGSPKSGDRFYRLSNVDLIFRAVDEAESAWQAIKGDVNELIRTLNLMDDMIVSEEVTLDGSVA